MALTNEDLLAISQLLDSKLNAKLQPIENRLRRIEVDLLFLPRIIRVQSVDIREQDQQIRADKRRDDRGQCVVVPDHILHLECRYRVIFIHDRDHFHRKQLVECILGIPPVQIRLDRIPGQQDLCCLMVVLRKNPLICSHEPGLSDRRARLFLRDGEGRLDMERLSAASDRARRHQDHVLALIPDIAQLPHEDIHLGVVQIPRLGVL